MKYAFVTLSIVAIWVATITVVYLLKSNSVFLPITALIMTIVLFIIGFARKK